MSNFSVEEYVDMLLTSGMANGNASEAIRLYINILIDGPLNLGHFGEYSSEVGKN